MIVLHEIHAKSGSLVEIALVETLEEVSPSITKDLRFQQKNLRQFGR